jgi:LysM repeat protein
MVFRVFQTAVGACILLLFSASAAFAATYTVQPGDSLFKIAQRFGTTPQVLQAANGLGNRTLILPGQRLTIPGAGTYTVRAGDSLFKIATRYGISYQHLMRVNGLTRTEIRPGQVLIIPGSGQTYVVRAGDSLFKIAQRYGISYRDLMRANGLTQTEVRPGQVLTIPAGLSGAAPSRWAVSSRDLDLLARLITAEADCQPFLVKVAVGAVVLNRVRSPLFPNSIAGVVYEVVNGRYQFEPVLNGWINRPASLESIRAAQAALAGEDPSWGALFFFEPWVTNRFLHTLPVARDLGAFRFAYAR